jgi:hypothetical protein
MRTRTFGRLIAVAPGAGFGVFGVFGFFGFFGFGLAAVDFFLATSTLQAAVHQGKRLG